MCASTRVSLFCCLLLPQLGGHTQTELGRAAVAQNELLPEHLFASCSKTLTLRDLRRNGSWKQNEFRDARIACRLCPLFWHLPTGHTMESVLDSHVFLGRLSPVFGDADFALEEAELVVEVVQRLAVWLLQQLRVVLASRPWLGAAGF